MLVKGVIFMRSFPGTVIICLQLDAGKQEIDEFFSRYRKVDGILVSELTNTYAVDVPAGEEMNFVEIFKKDPLVRKVNKFPLAGKKWVRRVVEEKPADEKPKKEKIKSKKSK
jgi:hypothetical protein